MPDKIFPTISVEVEKQTVTTGNIASEASNVAEKSKEFSGRIASVAKMAQETQELVQSTQKYSGDLTDISVELSKIIK